MSAYTEIFPWLSSIPVYKFMVLVKNQKELDVKSDSNKKLLTQIMSSSKSYQKYNLPYS